jgi:hypothetical protein
MPVVKENLYRLNDNKYISVADMKDMSYHIPMTDKHTTGIIKTWGSFQ